MRCAFFSMSLLLAIGGNVIFANAEEPAEFQLVGYSQPSEEDWNDGGEFDDPAGFDPRYTWDMSGGPPNINLLFAEPEYGSYLQADALWLARSHASSQTVAVTLPPASQPVLNSEDAGLTGSLQPGLLLTLGRRFDQVSAFELTFFGLNTWKESAEATGNGDLSLPGTLPLLTQDYIFADRIRIDYQSSLYNAEANYTQTIAGLKLLGGFRYLRLNESFDINSYVSAIDSSSDYLVRTSNNLIGGQFGVGFDWNWDRLTVELLGKAGVYANIAEQNTLMKDLNNSFVRRDYQDHTTATSVIGEIDLNASYRLLDWLSFRAGYRFIWINNIAMAPDQLNFTTDPGAGASVTAHNHLILNGVNVGLEARW